MRGGDAGRHNVLKETDGSGMKSFSGIKGEHAVCTMGKLACNTEEDAESSPRAITTLDARGFAEGNGAPEPMEEGRIGLYAEGLGDRNGS